MIVIKELTKVFEPEGFIAVDKVCFEVAEGEIACLIGASGCGKTTTLKMINHLIEPTSGQILIQGEPSIAFNPVEWRRKIGYVIQKSGLFPHLTVGENIGILATVKKRKSSYIDARVKELLELVGLDPKIFQSRFPAELSGGQQQRVGIARALMEDPPILLMDEPFGALDPITRNSMRKEFKSLNRNLKKTIIMVTHDLEEAFSLGDRVALMNAGKIIQTGNRDSFKRSPANDFVKEFVSDQIS